MTALGGLEVLHVLTQLQHPVGHGPGVCRVHYFAPTEGGNSGSPVFDDSGWRVIALHHSGGNFGMPRLNGAAGTYAANEGLALFQITAAVRAARG